MADKRIVTVDYLNSEGLNKDYINNSFANALKGSKSGSAILIDDVSPVTHDMDVKVRGKNLLNLSNREIITNTYSPSTAVRSFNGNQLFVGISSNNYFVTPNIVSYSIGETITVTAKQSAYGLGYDVAVEPNTSYAFSSITTNGEIRVGLYNKDGTFSRMVNAVSTFTTKSTEYWAVIVLVESVGNDGIEASFTDIQLEFGTTATPYTPYVPDLTAVKVTRCGKNLLDPSLYNNTATFQGITYTTNGDIVTLTGTARASSYVNIFSSNPDGVIPLPSILNNKKIKLYAYGNSYTVELLIRKTTGVDTVSANNNQSIDTTGAIGFSIRCRFASGNTYNDSIKFMITEEGVENNTAYEPYIAPTEYTPAADGTVNGVTSLYPNTTLMTDTAGVIIDCEYNRDINKAFAELQQAIISLGGNV